MRNENNVNILFWLRVARANKAGAAPIMCRITCNGVRAGDFSTKLKCNVSEWNAKRQIVKGASENSKTINQMLDGIRAKINKIWLELENNDMLVTASKLKELYLGNGQQQRSYTFLGVYDLYLAWYKKRLKAGEVGNRVVEAVTAKRQHLIDYLSSLGMNDVFIDEVTRAWFEDIKLFLLVEKRLKVNTSAKTMACYKAVLEYAVNHDYLEKNPFRGLTVKKEYTDPDFLELEHLEILENYEFENATFDRVRDFFIFCCYTGLAWTDYDALTQSEVVEQAGGLWLDSQRQKGRSQNYGKYFTPISEKALEIYHKYGSNVENLPKMTNQTFNRFLKEIQAVVGIERGKGKSGLHCHLARHTFVWLALNKWELEKDLIIEMVGHSSKRMLDFYAKIGNERVVSGFERRNK